MSIESEILALRDPEGFFKPVTVVEWAKANPDSDLHNHKAFLWNDDARAAGEYRLNVARTLIRIHVRTEEGGRGTFSLIQDRHNEGGYREIKPVLTNAELRAMALRQALRELRALERRFKYLTELAAVFAAADKIEAAAAPKAAA